MLDCAGAGRLLDCTSTHSGTTTAPTSSAPSLSVSARSKSLESITDSIQALEAKVALALERLSLLSGSLLGPVSDRHDPQVGLHSPGGDPGMDARLEPPAILPMGDELEQDMYELNYFPVIHYSGCASHSGGCLQADSVVRPSLQAFLPALRRSSAAWRWRHLGRHAWERQRTLN